MNKLLWHSAELHCHTLHSDGSFTVKELMDTAAERGVEGICLTDHNTMSGWEETDKYHGPVVLKGIEWTTYFGHMLVLDCKEWVDWRDAVPDNIDEKMTAVHKGNGLVGMAHPFQLGTPICTGGHWDYNIKDYSLVNYMEIWSEGCPYMNPANEKAKKKWLDLLEKGYRITPTFGRDWHRTRGNELIGACTYLLCQGELTPQKMKDAIEKGRTQITVGPLLIFETEKGETAGDTLKKGQHTFKIKIDTGRYEKLFSDSYSLEIKTLKVITKKGETVYEGRADKEEISLFFEENSFYIFELWGSVEGKENQLLTLTSPVYTE